MKHGKGFQVWMFIIGLICLMMGSEMPIMSLSASLLLGPLLFIIGIVLLWMKSFYYGKGFKTAYIIFGIIFTLAGFGALLGALGLTEGPQGANETPIGDAIVAVMFVLAGVLLFIRAYLHHKWGLCGEVSTYSGTKLNTSSKTESNHSFSSQGEIERIPIRPSERPPKNVNRPAIDAYSSTDYEHLKTFSMKDIDAISDSDLPNKVKGDKFEHYCARLLNFYGFTNIQVVGGKNDRGADIICWKYKKKYIIQCKCYNHKVHVKEYDQTFSGRANYAASEAILLTNNTFTEEVIDRASEQHIILWDRNKLQELIDTANEEAEFEE